MAIKNNIFVNCNDQTNNVVLQYNDIFFVPGTIANYNGGCWIDTEVSSNLVPVFDVTFYNYATCEDCIINSQSGFVLENCTNSELAVVTFQTNESPSIGSFVNYDNDCWEVISTTGATPNLSPQLNSYLNCATCLDFNTETEEYSPAIFVNCCNPSDTKIFNIVSTNFGFPLGQTVVYNNLCYTYSAATLGGTISGSYVFPQFYDCTSCLRENACPTPTPTPSNTATPSPTPSFTPTVSLTSTPTPTPTKTPGLPPPPTTTTTTTTRPTSRNECDPITLFPLGVECVTTDPTSPNAANGSISLVITGGTPPYSIVWSTGAVNTTTLSNLQSGSYTAFVIDYWGDFSAQTTCQVIAPSPTPTPTSTPTPTPSSTPTPWDQLCLTITVEGQPYQFEFDFYTIINGKPAWTASTTNTPVTTAGNLLYLSWTLATLSSGPSLGPDYRITGWDSPSWYLSSTSTNIPPLSNWFVLGSSPDVNFVSLISGACPAYTEITLTTYSNNATCQTSNDGSICGVVVGGSGNYEYSLDNITYVTSNCFYNLSPGNYTIYVKDLVSLSTASQNVIISNSGLASTTTMNFTLVSSTNNISGPSIIQNTKVYTLNTSSIPNGVTLNMSFALNQLLQVFEPGDGNNVGSIFDIEKNGVSLGITSTTTNNTLQNRPGCSPYKIQGTNTDYVASTTVTNADTINVYIVNKVTVTDPATDNCITRIENTISVNSSFTYNGLPNCVEVIAGNMNMGSIVSRNLGLQP